MDDESTTATPATATPSLDDAAAAAIREISAEFEPGPEAETPPAEGETPPEGAESEPTPEAPAAEAESPAIAAGMERLVAREVAVQAREAAAAAAEGRVRALESELAGLRAKLPAAEVTEKLYHSPSEAIKALGHSPRDVLHLLLAETLKADGKEVPAELAETLRGAEHKREVATLRARLDAKEQAEARAQYLAGIAAGAQAYATQLVGASKDAPTLAVIAKSDPARASREILEEIEADARARAAADPHGEPITYAEAAKRAEKRLSALRALLGPAGTAPSTQASGAPQKAPAKTPPTAKPAAKPLAPWLAKDPDMYSVGVDEATREFLRVEAANKRK